MTNPRRLTYLLISILVTVLIAFALMLAAMLMSGLDPHTQFYVPEPNRGATEQIASLTSSGKKRDANLIQEMINTPQAVWFTKGTPRSVQQDVRNIVQRAADKGQVPVLVAYNIPFRDCAQFSAGGATNVAEYKAWIDGFAAGIGRSKAFVILEPDSLGIIPWYNPFGDRDTWVTNPNYEWCQPAEANQATAAADRFAMLNYAVDRLKENSRTRVYLDGTHSGWLSASDTADRLIQAGVAKADGFFLNVASYQLNSRLEKYGTWISKCIAFASHPSSWGKGQAELCANQYFPADPKDFSTWELTDQWYADNVESQTLWYVERQTWWSTDSVLKHFVIDTSRNGQGPWSPTTSHPDAQDWCNPPDRGLGLRPTADTDNALIDAYLWVKIPGESDGECSRGPGPRGTAVEPEWDSVDPTAGRWIPSMVLELAKNANPPLP
jgi:endoglucanase